LAIRPDLEIEDLRGNVLTRIQKLRDEDYDAIMLAKAGVQRLGVDLSEFYVEEIQPMEIVPAAAQGVLAIQIRKNDQELFDQLQQINHPDVAEAIDVERKVLNIFEGGCHMPLGCYCRKDEGVFQIWTSKATDADEFPDRLFIEAKKTKGLAEIIAQKFAPDRKFPSGIFITRDLPEGSYLRKAMEKHNIGIEDRSLIKTYPIINKLDPYILKHVDWVFFSSKNGVEYFLSLKPEFNKRTKFGVLGRGSEEMLRLFGIMPDYNGEDEGIDTQDIAEEFAKIANGKTVLFPGAKDSMRTVQSAMSDDTKIIDLPVYETVMEEHVPQSYSDVLIFTSPSNVEAYFVDNLLEPGQQVLCIGKSTGRKFDEMGVRYTLPYSPDEIGLAEAVFGLNYK
jgi:hydroxymethylbilane synthase